MSCRVCRKLKIATVRELNEAILEGKESLVTLSTKYKIPFKYLNRHVTKCLQGGPKSGHATLQTLLQRVIKDLAVARREYRYGGGGDEDGGDSRGAAIFYSNLLREARELVVSIEKLQPNEELVAQINNQVITPFLNEMVRILLEEGTGLKGEMQTLLGSSYDKKVDAALKEGWKRIAVRFKLEAGKIHPKLSEIFPQESKPGKDAAKQLSQAPASKPADPRQLH